MKISYHQASTLIHKGDGGKTKIINGANESARFEVLSGALDAYMDEQGLDKVRIEVEATKIHVNNGKDGRYYQLDFDFGPSGAHFDPPLELVLTGKLVAGTTDVWLYDENGEALEAEAKGDMEKLTFYISHFSSYYYDDYDEY
jgi:hypothetical protein